MDKAKRGMEEQLYRLQTVRRGLRNEVDIEDGTREGRGQQGCEKLD